MQINTFGLLPTGLDTTEGQEVLASPSETTMYSVLGTAENGCSNTDSVIVLVAPVGINEHSLKDNEVKVYPNPSRNGFTVEFTIERDMLSLKLVNMLGQDIYGESLINRNGTYKRRFDLRLNKSGVYFLRIEKKNGMIIKRLAILPNN